MAIGHFYSNRAIRALPDYDNRAIADFYRGYLNRMLCWGSWFMASKIKASAGVGVGSW